MKTIEITNSTFPLIILETFLENENLYKIIDKKGLDDIILTIERKNDNKTIYFNLWKVDENTYNRNFQSEPCLTGREYHIHFMDFDLRDIEADGIDHYWKECFE